jgi:hypothetical protein
VAFTPEGQRQIWPGGAWVDKLAAMRCSGESMSDVIMRLAAAESG